MKRFGDLFPQICAFENLLAAERDAYRGKRRLSGPAEFHFQLEANLLELRRELLAGAYRPGPYHAFHIRDPKPRLISAAPYRDRVVEPVFERAFIFDSYANRRGKGTHRALDRCTHFARRRPYVLKCDVAKFFPSMDHDILLSLLERRLKCRPTLALLRLIVTNSNPQEPVCHYFPGDDLFTPHERRAGIPIGNLTSQFFANVMLSPLDHFLKEERHRAAYLRYADDFLVFGSDKRDLHALLEQIRCFLHAYRLALHPRKCVVLPVAAGIPFLGWRVYPDHRRLLRPTGVRFQRRLRELAAGYRAGEVELEDVRASVASWLGHLSHGDTWGLRARLLRQAAFTRRQHRV